MAWMELGGSLFYERHSDGREFTMDVRTLAMMVPTTIFEIVLMKGSFDVES